MEENNFILLSIKMRKSKTTKEELRKTEEKLKEIEELNRLAENEDQEKLISISGQILQIASDNEMFCGVILTKKDILAIVDLAMRSKDETVSIPFQVYFKD